MLAPKEQGLVLTATIGLILLTCSPTHAADPVLTPENVTDTYGNFANRTSSITWAAVPAGRPYGAGAIAYNDGGLGPLFNFARSFVNTVLPGSFPYNIVTNLLKGTFNIATDYMEIINAGIGLGVCIVIGFLYMIFMPLIGLCFCCCRLCGNCGGSMKRTASENDNTKRIIFSIIVGILAVFTAVGSLCMYVTNSRVAESISTLQTTLDTNLDDISIYLNNTVNELTYLANNNFNFTAEVAVRDLDNIGYLVGIPVRDSLADAGGVNAAIDSIIALNTNISAIGPQLVAVNTSIATIKSVGATLATEISDAQSDVVTAKNQCAGTAACDNLDTSVLSMDVNFTNLPDISAQVESMQTVLGRNLTALALQGRAEFDNIPERVTNETKTVVTSIKSLLTSFQSTITNAVGAITSIPTSLNGQFASIKTQLNAVWVPLKTYDPYRSYAGIGLACIVLFIVILQILGVSLGFCGHSANAEPHERGCLSNSSGNLLMASVGFIFIFSWLLMLLTVVCFVLGAVMEKWMCQPLADPNWTFFKTLLDGPGGVFNEYMLGAIILQNGTINLTFSGVLQGCKDNGAALTVLKLDSLFDLTMVTDYKKSIDIQSQVDAINVDLSTVKLLSADTETQLRDFSGATGIDYSSFRTELGKNTTQTNLQTYANNIRTIASGVADPAKTSFNNAATKIDGIYSGSFQTVNTQQAQLLTAINNLETVVQNVPAGVNATIDAAKAVESYLGMNGSGLIKTAAASYGNRILGAADSFATNTLYKVMNEVGRCSPIYNLYNSVLLVAVCKYVIDVLNGFWFSIGWSLFFMTINMIFCVKLAKYLRTMEPPNDEDDHECSSERGDKSPPPPPPGFVPGVLVESEKGTIPNEGDVYEESLDQEEDKKIKDGEMLSSGLYTRENMETPPIPVLLMTAERTIIEEPYKAGKQSSAQSVRAGRESALSTRSNKVGVAGSADSVSSNGREMNNMSKSSLPNSHNKVAPVESNW